MIRVKPQPEPATFDKEVRQPGNIAIAKFKSGKIKKLPAHWRHCIEDLWAAYDGICAYMCTYISRVTGAKSVEHFAPKSKAFELAYEWKNYRLACATINGWKKDFEDVLDPFEIQTGWFVLDFPRCSVEPAPGLAAARRSAVAATIARLKLNHSKCIDERQRYWDDYRDLRVDFRFLERYAPFLAIELKRRGLLRAGER